MLDFDFGRGVMFTINKLAQEGVGHVRSFSTRMIE